MSIVLDPKGYFLIKVENNQIVLGFCNYQNKDLGYKNKIEKTKSSDNAIELIEWAKDLCSLESHYDYLVEEITKAQMCLKNNQEYIQE